VVIREDSACVKAFPEEVRIREPELLEVDFRAVSPSCDQCRDGEIILSIIGGTPPYFVQWASADTVSRLRNIGLGTYPVWVLDANGCSAGRMIDLEMGEETVLIPNAFSPRSNNINARWEISLLKDKPLSQVFVFDRSGRKIWESQPGYPEPWDGTGPGNQEMPQGTYFYLIRVHPDIKPLTGTVTIIR
jgi:gliding motility-associated-like protein